MEIEPKTKTTNGHSKYRRAIPIFGLLFYYLGALIASLDVQDNVQFLIVIAALSIILIIGLQWPMNKWIVILGEILLIVGSLGPIAELTLSLLGYGALGGAVMLLAIIFHLIGISIWLKE